MGMIGRLDGALKTHVPDLWRRTKTLVLLALFLVVYISIVQIALDLYGSHKLSEAREAAAAAGVPVSMEALLATLPEIPDNENAANYYEAAFALMRAKGRDPDRPTVPIVSRPHISPRGSPETEQDRIAKDLKEVTEDPRVSLPDYVLEDSKAYITRRREILDLVHEGAALPDTRYHIQWHGYDTSLPHLTAARSAARLVSVAAWVDADEKRPHDAVAKVHDIMALSRSLADDPTFLSSLVEGAIAGTGTSCLARVLARCDADSTDLEGLQKDFEDFAEALTVRLGLQGELAMYCDFENSIIDGSLSPQDALAKIGRVESLSSGEKARPAKYKGLGRLAASILKGYLKADEALAIKCYLDIIKEARNPSPECLVHGSSASAEVEHNPFLLVRMMIPSLVRATSHTEQLRAQLRSTAAVLAALRFKNDSGAWPENLDALVPEYLAQVPVDPFTGGPLIYTLREGGIVVYSAGQNGVDDGGRGRELSIEKDYYDDMGFRVWR